jgi:hypothetical protein
LAIDKNEPGTGQMSEYIFFQGSFGGGIVCRFSDGLERQPGQRRHVGETPVFILQRRETEFSKARNAHPAQRQQPRRLQRRFKAAEGFEKWPKVRGLRLWYHDLIAQFYKLDLQFPMPGSAAQVWSGLNSDSV